VAVYGSLILVWKFANLVYSATCMLTYTCDIVLLWCLPYLLLICIAWM
jgi:hypothetical protein